MGNLGETRAGTFAVMTLLAVSLANAAETDTKGLGGSTQWVGLGPGPIADAFNVEGAPVNGEQAGAVNVVAPHPTRTNILYIGTTNGGIWRTTNAQATDPNWVRQTDDLPSMSIGAIAFDTQVASGNTLVAGISRASSLGSIGGERIGVIRSTTSGNQWTVLPGMEGRDIAGLAVNGNVIVAGVRSADSFNLGDTGIWRSTDTGQNWTRVTDGFPGGLVDALVQDPNDPDTLYASLRFATINTPGAENGIYKSQDAGASWFKSSPPTASGFPLDTVLEDDNSTHVEMAIGNDDNLYVAISPGSTNKLGGVFYTLDGGSFWFFMDLPGSLEPSFFGIHPGSQGNLHMSIAVDPTNENIVYLGGDRQPAPEDDEGRFPTDPNSLGARAFSGRLFRGDVTNRDAGEWFFLTHVGTQSNSAPHADSRDMAFDVAGNLIQGDDGGVYRRTSPRSANGDWVSAIGNLQATESHSGSYDALADIVETGNQDNGFTRQIQNGDLRWTEVLGGDGGDSAIVREANRSLRYGSIQNLGNFFRATYNASNVFQTFVFPDLLVTGGGEEFMAQFTTPIAANATDTDRIMLGGSNGIFESFDQGDTISMVAPGLVAGALAFGGRTIEYGAVGNADISYVAGCIGQCGDASDGVDGLYIREGANDTFEHVFPASGDGFVSQVAMDIDRPARAYFIESGRVFRGTQFGANFTDITGNLLGLNPGRLFTIMFMSNPPNSTVVVGANRGVFAASQSTGFSSWSRLGTGMPNAPVSDLDFDLGRNKLVATTLGRGAFSLSPVFGAASDEIFSDGFE